MKIPGITTERMTAIFSRQSKLQHRVDAFSIKMIRNETDNVNRVGIITGKKQISKSAVIRNRADRRIKAAIQTVYPQLKVKGKKKVMKTGERSSFFFSLGYDYLIFSQAPVITMPWPKLLEQVQKSFSNLENKLIPKVQRK